MVVCFLLGSRSLFSPHPLTVPTWVLPMVLRFLRISHFEPLQFTNLWPLGVRALRIYIERSAPFKQSEQHFVCFSGQAKGLPVTKQRLSRLIVDAISVAYSYLGLQCPIGVRAHSSRGVASSWAWPSRCVHCRALKSGWLGLVIHLFMFYNLESRPYGPRFLLYNKLAHTCHKTGPVLQTFALLFECSWHSLSTEYFLERLFKAGLIAVSLALFASCGAYPASTSSLRGPWVLKASSSIGHSSIMVCRDCTGSSSHLVRQSI